jgi:hypothetical protein
MRAHDLHNPARRHGDEGTLMRRLVRLAAVVAGAAGMSIAGIAAAYANWTVHSAWLMVEMKTLAMPAFYSPPAVQPQGRKVTVSWVAQRMEKGVKVERYIVVRHDPSGHDTQVCGTATTTCKDTAIPDGTWSYTVRTAYASWQGPDSPSSVAVKIGEAGASLKTPKAATEATALTAPQPPSATTATPDGSPQSPVDTTSSAVASDTSEPGKADESEPPASSTPDATATTDPAPAETPSDTATD